MLRRVASVGFWVGVLGAATACGEEDAPGETTVTDADGAGGNEGESESSSSAEPSTDAAMEMSGPAEPSREPSSPESMSTDPAVPEPTPPEPTPPEPTPPEPTPPEPTPSELDAATDVVEDVPGEWEACATGSISVRPAGAAVLLLIDRSSSMNEDNRWTQVVAALDSFFLSPDTSGMAVGLRFFPDEEGGGCAAPECDSAACGTPLVNAEPLAAASGAEDVQEMRLTGAVEATQVAMTLSGGTPLYEVLAGGLDWAAAFQSADPSVRTSVLLLTDGEASGCNESLDDITARVANAYDGSGIATYVVGFDGIETQQIERIAEAGGTEASFLQSGVVGQQFLEALVAVRAASFSCDFVPSQPDAEAFDPSRVNLVLETPSGEQTRLDAVEDEQACAGEMAWYYPSPERIALCPVACEAVRAESAATLTVVFGCATEW